MALTWWWYPSRRFEHDGRDYTLRSRARTDGLVTQVHRDGVLASEDRTPITGPDAVRNHRHAIALPDGRTLDVEAGYAGLWTLGLHARVDGATVHESDPGRELTYPEPYKSKIIAAAADPETVAKNKALTEQWKRNRLPLAVDIGCSLLFFVLAKAFGLTTAALAMAGVGVMGLVMAGLNYVVATLVSTDWWLFYTTFLDLPLVFAFIFLVFRYARGGTGSGRTATSAAADLGLRSR